jgi:hypothetical protein
LSIRLNDDERRDLAQRAGDMPISTYVKRLVFPDGASLARNYPVRPSAERVLRGKLLAIWVRPVSRRTWIGSHSPLMPGRYSSMMVRPGSCATPAMMCV